MIDSNQPKSLKKLTINRQININNGDSRAVPAIIAKRAFYGANTVDLKKSFLHAKQLYSSSCCNQ